MGWFGIGKEIAEPAKVITDGLDKLFTMMCYHNQFKDCIMNGGFRKTLNIENKVCFVCNKTFIPYRKTDIHCSKECRSITLKRNQSERKHPSQSKESRKNATAQWRHNNQAKAILSTIKSRDKCLTIDEEWIQHRLDKGCCEVTGIKFIKPAYGENKRGFNHSPWSPSVDRINHAKGYLKENCRLVVWAYNRARGLWADDVVLQLARGILNVDS